MPLQFAVVTAKIYYLRKPIRIKPHMQERVTRPEERLLGRLIRNRLFLM